jgi:hypothetical protein
MESQKGLWQLAVHFFNLVEDGYFRKHFFSFIFQLNSNIFVLMFGNSFERTIVKDK